LQAQFGLQPVYPPVLLLRLFRVLRLEQLQSSLRQVPLRLHPLLALVHRQLELSFLVQSLQAELHQQPLQA
jgi:hypothetical protein